MSKIVTFASRIRTEGKITIPKEYRELLNLKRGDIVEVSLKKPAWYEMLDWDEIDLSKINIDALPPEAAKYILKYRNTEA